MLSSLSLGNVKSQFPEFLTSRYVWEKLVLTQYLHLLILQIALHFSILFLNLPVEL